MPVFLSKAFAFSCSFWRRRAPLPFPAIPPIFLSSDCYFHGLTRCTTPATNLMNEVKQSLESAPKCALPLLSAPTTRGKLDFSCLTLLEALMVAGRAATTPPADDHCAMETNSTSLDHVQARVKSRRKWEMKSRRWRACPVA